MLVDHYTPDYPSPRAMRRVKHPVPIPCQCRYCDGDVICVKNHVVYGVVYGEYPWIYMCEDCRAYVGLHSRTNIPLGSLADTLLRKKRGEAKELFLFLKDKYKLSRDDAYAQLAVLMKRPPETTHFAMFEVEDCDHALKVLLEINNG